MTNVLVIRFSALGDVAMTVPVVRCVALQYPHIQFSVLSAQHTTSLWQSMPQNVHFIGADLKGKHKGISGLQQLLREIDYRRFDAVADLHDVLRSNWIDRAFLFAGKKVATIRKGRLRKWLTVNHITRLHPSEHALLLPIQTTIQRYTNVFARLGLPLDTNALTLPVSEKIKKGIGIAPFAAHKGKIYPVEKMEEVVRRLAELLQDKDEPIYLFGAGDKEKAVLENWEKQYKGVTSLAGKQTMAAEIEIMSGLRLMLTMDSANMHLASLAGTRVLSIWGATHPALGFLGFGQKEDDCLQRELKCRPCSVYGNRACKFRDYRCLNISPDTIVQRVMQVVEQQ